MAKKEAPAQEEAQVEFKQYPLNTTVKEDVDGNEREFKGTVSLPTTTGGFVSKYGEDLALALLVRAMVSRLRAYVRPYVEGEQEFADDGKTVTGTNILSDEDIQTIIDNYEPSASRGRPGKTVVEKFASTVDTIDSEDDLDAMLARLQARKAALANGEAA